VLLVGFGGVVSWIWVELDVMDTSHFFLPCIENGRKIWL